MPLIQGDFAGLLHAVASGEGFVAPRMAAAATMTVVVAAKGYPGTPTKGASIHGVDAAEAIEGVTVFHAGTVLAGEELVASGGRVLAVTAIGDNLSEARDRAYRAVERIAFADGFSRSDIGWRELERLA